MSKQSTPKRGQTPPKGRPTRSRNGSTGGRRVFGPVTQWIMVALLIAMVFVIIVIVTDGGDFNPFNDETVGSALFAQLAPSLAPV